MRVILLLTLACLFFSASIESTYAEKLSPRARGLDGAITERDAVQRRYDVSPDRTILSLSRCVTLLIEHLVIARTPAPFFVLIDSDKSDNYDEPSLNPPPHDGKMRRFVNLDEDPWEEQK